MTSFIPPDVKTFVSWDYVVFAALFLISSSIGIFFAVKERKKTSSTNFLVGGRQMTCGPVALSLTASFMSAVTVLGTPAEVYRHGSSFVLFFIAYAFVVLFTAELFLPVFYKSGITSTYEYLELRFNRLVRVAATLIYIVQTIVYTGVVVYAPALALNQVTGFNLWGSVFATGIVCTFYCTLGGLKAVVWTDAFQLVVMVIGFLTVLIQGTLQNGGLGNVWEDAKNGSRLDIFEILGPDYNPAWFILCSFLVLWMGFLFIPRADPLKSMKFNFDADPLKRHTFWTIAVGGTFTWLGIYGVNQSTIQRCISCKTEKHAKLALYLNLVGLWIILICAVLCGLVMYSHFRSCDPWTAGFISAPDQLMPYFVMILFSSVPGLPGLFVACAFSGTLSTVAASINALATVTFEDFVKSCFPKLSERMNTWVSKGLCIVFGVLCTTMAVAASLMGGVVQASLSIHGMCGGPMLGLFTLGVLFPCTNWKGALGGLFTGISLAFWVGIGAFVYPAPPSKTLPLHLSTAGCIVNNTDAVATVLPTVPPIRPYLADTWYSLSYLYYSAVGCLGCIMAGLLISFVTGPSKGEDITPTLIRPVCNLFCFWSPKCKTLCWCGVDHDNCKGLHEELKIDWQKDHTKKAEASDVQKNGLDGLSISIQSHLPGYNPSEKSYTNPGMETESHF